LLLKATSDSTLEKLKREAKNKEFKRKVKVVRKGQVEKEREIKTISFN
jgi:wobble nucleotide-excising tRNase